MVMLFLIRMGNCVYIQMALAISLRTLLGCVQQIFSKGSVSEVTIFREPLAKSRRWDQFEVNESLAGVKTTFNEELCTTNLERGSRTRALDEQAQSSVRELEGFDEEHDKMLDTWNRLLVGRIQLLLVAREMKNYRVATSLLGIIQN